jgi:transcriptional/translational regulatory protein YebC/TACO1
MFNRNGVVEATHTDSTMDLEAVAIEAGAQNIEPLEAQDIPAGQTGGRFICETTDLDAVSKYLSKHGWTVTTSEMSYLAKNFAEVNEDQKKEVAEFLNAIDDNDDVHRVYAALK